jgi:hypothetical protein
LSDNKFTHLLLAALGRASLAPGGTPLIGTRSAPGLFPATAQARQAAQRARDEGLIRRVAADPKGKPDRDLYSPTEAGMALLLHESSPKQVLEDLARAVEARQKQFGDLLTVARETQTELVAVRELLGRALSAAAHPTGDAGGSPEWIEQLRAHLVDWSGAGDCPLPDLYRSLQAAHPELTIGRFHDGLRYLHDREQVYLHPWTGPLYALPEPQFALLVGHEVAYYASARTAAAVVEYQTNGVLA